MPLYTVLDFEATSKYASSAQPLSLSYLTFEGTDYFNPVESGTLFFWKEGTFISAENFAIHGLSESYLKPYEKMYSQNCRKLYRMTQGGNLIGQNIKGYDLTLLNSFLEREGYLGTRKNYVIEPLNVFDTRYSMGSSHNQKDMLEMLELEHEDILYYWKLLFPNSVFKEEEVVKHNGEFDVTGTLLIFMNAVRLKKFNIK